MDLLEIAGLSTSFTTRSGVIKAVDNVSLSLRKGRVLGLVGESGCGKTMTALSILNLVPPPGRITAGKIFFEDRDLLTLSEAEMRKVRGARPGAVRLKRSETIRVRPAVPPDLAQAL